MTATDELRRLLDERGVEYRWDNGTATWYVNGVMYNAWGYDNERLTMSVCHLTPAQAIAATLGAGTCHDEGDPTDFCCSECGVRMFTDTGETYTMIDSLGNIIEQPSYCPNCGRKVVDA